MTKDIPNLWNLPMPNTDLQIFLFKYKIGDKFENGNGIIEITGYNHHLETYKGIAHFKNSSSIDFTSIDESILDNMTKIKEEDSMVSSKIRYVVYYYDLDDDGNIKKGQTANKIEVNVDGVCALAKTLNRMVKNYKRRVTLVTIVDERGVYLNRVEFLTQEIKEQVFLTGMKERLLAHAKYVSGYEISIGF